MRILYAIQGTGNGHLSRAKAIIPELLSRGVILDLLVSGIQSDIPLPYEVKYRKRGLSFIFGKQGGVDLWNTYLRTNVFRIIKEVRSLPVKDYDFVLNDFEPISAWACKLRGVPCIGVSHQAAVLAPAAPQPEKRFSLGALILKRYAPVSHQYGFHFQSYQSGIYTPVIRKGIRKANKGDKGHYTVYLPAYSDRRILEVLRQIPQVQWQVFSKHSKKAYRLDNVQIKPIQNMGFLGSIAMASGVLCAAGFETPSESLYMGKKLCVIPMKRQFEQQCNAVALAEMGVPVIPYLSPDALPALRAWVASDHRVEVNYPEVTAKVVDRILSEMKEGSRVPTASWSLF